MNEQIKAIEGLIKENQAVKERTPFLDGALGGLRTALDNTKWHVEAQAKAAKEAAPKAAK